MASGKSIPRLYLETTVVSYLTARPSRDIIVEAHQRITSEWWHKRKENFRICISQIVLDEVAQGDKEASVRRMEIVAGFDILELTDEVHELAKALVDAGSIPEKFARDAVHIAVAAVHGLDYLMTWNCTHIANAEIERKVRQICTDNGFECPVICTPEELLGE